MRLSCLMPVTVMLSVITPSLFADDITLLKLLRPGRVEETGTGDYDRLLAIINASVTTPIKLRFASFERIRRTFADGIVFCQAPGNIDAFQPYVPGLKTSDYISTDAIDVVTGHILSRPEEPTVSSVQQLKDKRIAIWWGVTEQFIKSTEGIFEKVQTEDQAVQLLMAGRVDYAWGWLPDTPMHYERMGYSPPNFDINFTLLNAPLYITCLRTPVTEAFIEEANKILGMMREGGHLKRVLSPYAHVAGVDIAWEDIK